MVKRLPKVAVCRNVRKRVLVALPFSHLSQRKLSGIFRYVCEGADWDLNIMSDGSLLTPEAFDIIANEGVDGVIVSADGVECVLAEIAKRNIPAALIGPTYFPRSTNVAFVHTDESSIGREAAFFFLKRAHWRSYGYVHAKDSRGGWDARRAHAFSATLSHHAVKCHEFPETVQSDRSGKALEIWLKVLPKPAAVFASDDYRAYEVISACKAVGIRVPADVAVIGVGNTEVLCENAVPSISSIEPDYYNEGYLAAKYLDRIMSAGRPIKAENVSGGVKGVIARNSTSKPKESSGLLVQKALAYIRANVCRGIDVQDVVAHLHVSRTLADLRFREVLGTTILSTIVDERLERTRRELMNSDESITSVCSRCGWKSENHPKKLFRAKYGQSMRAFRNSSKNNQRG